jgi:hypothetical protein
MGVGEGSLLEPGHEPVVDLRQLDYKFTNYIEGSRKSSRGACSKAAYLHLKVKCRFEQQFGKCLRDGCTFGHTEEAKLKVCRYFQTSTCIREPCRFEHKLLDRGVCWAAYEQHCRHGTNCGFRHVDTGATR